MKLLEDQRNVVGLLEDPRKIYQDLLSKQLLEVKRLHKQLNKARNIIAQIDLKLTKAKLIHNRIDRKLAFMDGRYKVIEPHYHRSEERPIDTRKLVKKLTQSEKDRLIEELMKQFGGGKG